MMVFHILIAICSLLMLFAYVKNFCNSSLITGVPSDYSLDVEPSRNNVGAPTAVDAQTQKSERDDKSLKSNATLNTEQQPEKQKSDKDDKPIKSNTILNAQPVHQKSDNEGKTAVKSYVKSNTQQQPNKDMKAVKVKSTVNLPIQKTQNPPDSKKQAN